MALDIQQIPVLSDNYVYLIHEPREHVTAVVDPAVAGPVLSAAKERGWDITHILNTHHHGDHVGGNLEIKRKTGCTIVGPRSDRDRIPGIDVEVGDHDVYDFGRARAIVFDVPGHTRGHIAYYFPDSRALFCGDTLFAMGCGRLFEGTPRQMLHSLGKFEELPGETLVYCAHEYSQTNAHFALTVDPENPDLMDRARSIDAARADDKSTVPFTLAEERRTNPFLRSGSPGVAKGVDLEGADELTVFAEVRRRRNHW